MSSAKDEQPSFFMTCVISFGALSGGFATGVWYQFRKSNFKFDFRKHHSDVKFAVTALGAGTALCFGTFGFLGSLFVLTTGVSNFRELGFFFRSVFKGEKVDGPSETLLQYKRETANMTLEEEARYWYNHYIQPELDKQTKKDAVALLKENVSEKELLEWEARSNDKNS